jgi:DNA-directed RNA polymerase specialized sigma24 family protein
VGVDDDRAQRFRRFCIEVEPGLRRGLVAAYGPDIGSDAAAEALTWAWQHFERVESMGNPAGYLWRVGQTASRRELREHRRRTGPTWDVASVEPSVEFEPGLPAALGSLSARQRTAVLLVHGHGYSLAGAAEVMGCRIRTLRNHLERGMAKLRRELGVDHDA